MGHRGRTPRLHEENQCEQDREGHHCAPHEALHRAQTLLVKEAYLYLGS